MHLGCVPCSRSYFPSKPNVIWGNNTLNSPHLHLSTYDFDLGLGFNCLFKCVTKHFKHQELLLFFSLPLPLF